MLSHTRRSQPRTLSNQSAPGKDLPQSLQRRSVQSINNFSFRRLLGNEPVSSPLGPLGRPRFSSEDSNSLDGIRTTDRNNIHQSPPSRSSGVIPQSLTKERRSYQGNKDHQVQDSILLSNADSDSYRQSARIERESHPNRQRPASALSSSQSLSESLLRPLLSLRFNYSRNMGNKVSTQSHSNPLQEDQPPRTQTESDNVPSRPVSSPLPAPSGNSSLKVVIPDRHSSITARLTASTSIDHKTAKPFSSELSQQKSPDKTEMTDDQELSPGHISVPSASSGIQSPTATGLPSHASPKTSSTRVSTAEIRPLVPLLTLTLSTPAPPLTPIHFSCYQSHRHVHFSTNIHNPVPCMACGMEGGTSRWKCQWCCLRICGGCMEVLGRATGRDLNILVRKLEEEGSRFAGGRLEEWGEKAERIWRSGGGEG